LETIVFVETLSVPNTVITLRANVFDPRCKVDTTLTPPRAQYSATHGKPG
jgi:hypothetical protein